MSLQETWGRGPKSPESPQSGAQRQTNQSCVFAAGLKWFLHVSLGDSVLGPPTLKRSLLSLPTTHTCSVCHLDNPLTSPREAFPDLAVISWNMTCRAASVHSPETHGAIIFCPEPSPVLQLAGLHSIENIYVPPRAKCGKTVINKTTLCPPKRLANGQ